MAKRYNLSQEDIDVLVSFDPIEIKPTAYCVGYNDVPFKVVASGIRVWQYDMWRTMLKRCLCEKYKATRPTYKDVSVCDEWLRFSNFFRWVNNEVGYGGKPIGLHLDKDLLFKGNKVYSPISCSFVPFEVNLLLGDCRAKRGKWPIGVSQDRRTQMYSAKVRVNGRSVSLGCYTTPEEAHLIYKRAKEMQIKRVAVSMKSRLKPAVFDSLMNWEV